MPHFSKKSKERLETCDPRLQAVFNEVVKHFDCSILEGHRPKVVQNAYYNSKPPRTKIPWPKSKHNKKPSLAVDAVPYPIDWSDRERFTYFAGFVMGVAEMLGVNLRWGGDWDRDTDLKDNKFDDLVHFELMEGE